MSTNKLRSEPLRCQEVVSCVNIWYYIFSVIILILMFLMYIYLYVELWVWFQISQTKMHASWHGRDENHRSKFQFPICCVFERWIWIEFISPSGFQIPSSRHCQFGQKQHQWHSVLWWTLVTSVFTFFLWTYNSNINIEWTSKHWLCRLHRSADKYRVRHRKYT